MATERIKGEFDNANQYTDEIIQGIVRITEEQSAIQHPNPGLNGCGIIYIWFGYTTLKSNSRLASALKAANFNMRTPPYNKGVMLRIGYDNADGNIAARAEAIVKAIKEWKAIPCAVHYHAD